MTLCLKKAEEKSGMEVKEGGGRERGREGEREKGKKEGRIEEVSLVICI